MKTNGSLITMQKEELLLSPEKLRGGGTQRIGYIDSLKGFATLCVVLGHVVNGYLDAGVYTEASTLLYRVFNIIYAFHMPLFLMISGYVFQKAYFDEKGRVKRLRRNRQLTNLLFNYITFSLAYGLVKIFFGRWTNQEITFTDLLLIWAKPIDLYWYLYDLLFFYLIFSIRAVQRARHFVMTGLLFFMSCLSGFIAIPWFDISRLCHNAFFFYLGMNLPLLLGFLDRHRPAQVIALSLTAVLWIVFWYGAPYTEQAKMFCYHQRPVINTLIALGTALILWRLFQKVRPLSDSRILRLLGRHSLEIYLIHCFLTAGFRVLFQRLGFDHAIMSVLLNTVLSTGIPLAISFLCTRMGIDTLLFRPANLPGRKKRGL